jgi:DNA-binding CsgD family transcriptional regulator
MTHTHRGAFALIAAHNPRAALRTGEPWRELAVLRLTSMGGQTAEVAQELGLGEETIRSHPKRAQTKLGARNRTHAACEALRRQLVP